MHKEKPRNLDLEAKNVKIRPVIEAGGKIVSEKIHNGQPIQHFRGVYVAPMDDPSYEAHIRRWVRVTTELAIHPNNSGRIIVNVPGFNGEIGGYNDKYTTLASHIQAQDLAAVVRVANVPEPGFLIDINLRKAMRYALDNAQQICGNDNPEIMLMGVSAGASAIAADAHEYPNVTTIILGAPSGNMPRERIEEGMAKFKGKVVILIGDNDQVVGNNAGQIFYNLATGASSRELFTLSDCDHQFTGESNGRIFSQAPFYAFGKDPMPTFPDPQGGIKLYD